MGLLDQLALRAAGVAGKYQGGRLAGEQERYKRDTTSQARADDLERQALERMLLEQRNQEETQYRRDLMEQNEAYRRDALTQSAADREAARVSAEARNTADNVAAAERNRDTIQSRKDLVGLAASIGAGGRAGVQAQRDFQREQALSEAYMKATKDMIDAHQFVSSSLVNAPLAEAGNGAAQVEMLYAFIKSLDPDTAVREGEIELARQATRPWSLAKSLLDKYTNNEAMVVPPDLIREMRDLMVKRATGYEKRVNTIRSGYLSRAQRARLENPDELFVGIAAPEAPPPGASSTPPGGTKKPKRSIFEVVPP